MQVRAILSSCYKIKEKLRLRISIFLYSYYLKKLIRKVSAHRPVRIVFYVNNLPMWKSDKLLMLLKDDKRFEPLVVSHLYATDSLKRKQELETELSSHFNALGVVFSSGFDFTKNRLFPASKYKADIIFYPQPYKNKLKEIPGNVLLSYIPYCIEMDKTRRSTNTLYQNICWKYFVTTSYDKEIRVNTNFNHGSNVIVAGSPIADYFLDGHTPSSSIWPVKDPKIKRVIWAPHHSILPDDWLDYSTFLEIADEMLEIVRRYKDKVQFVFKPHPMLKEKLYRLNSWGTEKTDQYYDAWKSTSNCNLANGNYVDLFMTSDALIHDCSSFTAEYLYVNKPVMFLTNKQQIETFNAFADSCFQVHYHGSSISDIGSFIDNVIKGNDPLIDKRTRFINDVLISKSKLSTAENIYNELCKIFE